MNRKLNTDNYQYQLNQIRRDNLMRAAENQRLAQIAAEPATRRAPFAGLRNWFQRSTSAQPNSGHHLRGLRRVLHLMVITTFAIALLWATATPSFAQVQSSAHINPGNNEMYHPVLVSYRIGYYYQFQRDQQRAIAKFTEAIELLPNYAYGATAMS
jgi:hypothetical protein